MRHTIIDVAKRAGASPSTVSRVLNQNGYVSAETRSRVEQAALELGYQPNWQARALKGKSSGLVGLIIPDISNTYYTAVAQGVTARLRAHSYEPVLCVNNEDPLVDLHYLQILQQKRVDGILYAHPAGGTNRPMVEELVRSGMPVVEINRQHAPDLLDAALADNYLGAHQMTRYLLDLGHLRIGLILGESELVTGNRRLAGYCRAHDENKRPVDTQLVRIGSFTREHGEKATRELLALPQRPTAIFAGSNRILMGCLAVLGEYDLTVPERHLGLLLRQQRVDERLAAANYGRRRCHRRDIPAGCGSPAPTDLRSRWRAQAGYVHPQHDVDSPRVVPGAAGFASERCGAESNAGA